MKITPIQLKLKTAIVDRKLSIWPKKCLNAAQTKKNSLKNQEILVENLSKILKYSFGIFIAPYLLFFCIT